MSGPPHRPRPGDTSIFTERTPRVAAARRLTRRRARQEERAFLAEGPQAVREALHLAARHGSGVRELFTTDDAARSHPDLVRGAADHGIPVSRITDRAAASLSETVTPQGLVAVCEVLDVDLTDAAPTDGPTVILADVRDPGNAGTVLRTADAAGAGAVVFAGQTVDPFNGKCVRASAGSLFHLAVVRDVTTVEAFSAARSTGRPLLAATGEGESALFELPATLLTAPHAWVFGNEARGLADPAADLADRRVHIPMFGQAESLNLAAAAAVCLFASARARWER